MSKSTTKLSGTCFDLQRLCEGMPALTPAMGQVHAEAAAVCLSKHGHKNEVALIVKRNRRTNYSIKRIDVTDRMERTYADLQVATEWGACGIAILVISHVTGLAVIERSIKGTGFDYWLGSPQNDLPFQKKARLEVSGILKGSDDAVKYRLTQKMNQMNQSAQLGYSGYAVVIEFSSPRADYVKK